MFSSNVDSSFFGRLSSFRDLVSDRGDGVWLDVLVEEFLLDELSHDSVEYFGDDLAAVLGGFPQLVFGLLVSPLLVQPVPTCDQGPDF